MALALAVKKAIPLFLMLVSFILTEVRTSKNRERGGANRVIPYMG
jgi:hypothetical protein